MSDNSSHASPRQLESIAAQALELAKKFGANTSDVMISRSTDFEVKVADGLIVSLSQADTKGLGLRVFVEGRMGFCTTSDFRADSLTNLAQRAVALARETAADPFNGIAETEAGRLDANAVLDLFDPKITEMSAEQKIAWAHEMEAAARQVDPRVCKFSDSGIATGIGETLLATSFGALRNARSTGISAWCNPIAEQNGELQTEFWYDAQTHLDDLENIATIGRIAGQRAARMLGAKPVKTQRVPVIFEGPMAAGLLGGMLEALDGDMIYKKASFLADKLGTPIAVPGLSLIDDPLLARGFSSSPFDGEGLKTYKKALVEQGVLKSYMYDSYTARKAGVAPTANGQRTYKSLPHVGCFNFYVENGTDDPNEIIRDVKQGLYFTRGLGRGVNAVSGEYSRGANGIWIENGEFAYPVQEITIAGDFLSMLKNIDRIGNDRRMRGSSGAPTLRIAEMTVSGQ